MSCLILGIVLKISAFHFFNLSRQFWFYIPSKLSILIKSVQKLFNPARVYISGDKMILYCPIKGSPMRLFFLTTMFSLIGYPPLSQLSCLALMSKDAKKTKKKNKDILCNHFFDKEKINYFKPIQITH